MTFVKTLISVAAALMLGMSLSQAQESDAESAQSPADGGVLIFGGTRNTGLEVAKLLAAKDVPVTAFVRPTSDRSGLVPLGAAFVEGEALDVESVRAAFEDRKYRAIVTTLGCNFCDTPPDYKGNRNVFDAAKAAGVSRVIFVSSIGAGNSEKAMPWVARLVLGENLKRKTKAEDHLLASDLAYTIIRPGNLKDGEPTGVRVLSEDPSTSGVIRRSDLAVLIVDALGDDATIGKVFSATSPES